MECVRTRFVEESKRLEEEADERDGDHEDREPDERH